MIWMGALATTRAQECATQSGGPTDVPTAETLFVAGRSVASPSCRRRGCSLLVWGKQVRSPYQQTCQKTPTNGDQCANSDFAVHRQGRSARHAANSRYQRQVSRWTLSIARCRACIGLGAGGAGMECRRGSRVHLPRLLHVGNSGTGPPLSRLNSTGYRRADSRQT